MKYPVRNQQPDYQDRIFQRLLQPESVQASSVNNPHRSLQNNNARLPERSVLNFEKKPLRPTPTFSHRTCSIIKNTLSPINLCNKLLPLTISLGFICCTIVYRSIQFIPVLHILLPKSNYQEIHCYSFSIPFLTHYLWDLIEKLLQKFNRAYQCKLTSQIQLHHNNDEKYVSQNIQDIQDTQENMIEDYLRLFFQTRQKYYKPIKLLSLFHVVSNISLITIDFFLLSCLPVVILYQYKHEFHYSFFIIFLINTINKLRYTSANNTQKTYIKDEMIYNIRNIMQFLYEKDIIIIAEEIGRNTQPILNFNIHTKKQYSSEESEEIKRKIYDLQKQTENLFYLSA